MYLIQVIPPLDNDTVWRVTGDYFPVLYFSYQLYDQVKLDTSKDVGRPSEDSIHSLI